ncbi:hypothetical protein TGP89_244940 [Toxoplasma gondii p89]|uniref:Uncharacterized protein n=1 Tax=Toxoplasma gondii p89 TaxID=943119 RepID=A0A086JR20_TOXGO|nr:hypothetical protein TGP89_244940 [Toxoplasma gondii p89]
MCDFLWFRSRVACCCVEAKRNDCKGSIPSGRVADVLARMAGSGAVCFTVCASFSVTGVCWPTATGDSWSLLTLDQED